MPKETVISTNLYIESNDQVCHFQLKVPRGVGRIIGVETGILFQSGEIPRPPVLPFWKLPLTYTRKFVLGDLKLQTLESANIFYCKEVCLDPNINHGDFTSQFFDPKAYTHQKQSHEDLINLDGHVTILQGLYKNTLSLPTPYAYTVNVYVWLEAEE